MVQFKIAKTLISHNLHYIIASKIPRIWRNLCAQRTRIPVTQGPLVSTSLLLWHPQMQVEARSYKDEDICEYDQERLPCSLCQSSFKTNNEENCSVVSQMWISFWKTWALDSLDQKMRETIQVDQRLFKKPASLMACGYISAYETGTLHIWKGTNIAERYIKAILFSWSLLQGRICMFQQDNARLHLLPRIQC